MNNMFIETDVVHVGDAVSVLNSVSDESVNMVMCSPPYYQQRNYEHDEQIGWENTVDEYVENIVTVMDAVKQTLHEEGSLWINLGDKYIYKNKQLIPSQVAHALQDSGWIVRNDVTWHKKDPMPSSAKDRLNTCTEKLFHLTKKKQYYYDLDKIREPHKESTKKRITRAYHNDAKDDGLGITGVDTDEMGDRFAHPNGKNPGDVFHIRTASYSGEHAATYPTELCKKPILATCPNEICKTCHSPKTSDCDCDSEYRNGICLDPFIGSGTTGIVAKEFGRDIIGIELNESYAETSRERIGIT